MATTTILVVDDEKNIRRTLALVLDGEGHECVEAATFDQAVEILGTQGIDAAFVDVKLGEENGLNLLEKLARGEIQGADPTTPVIVISGHATIEEAVRATRTGAFDFLEKPLDRDRLVVTLRNALERRKMSREVADLRSAAQSRFAMVGRSAPMEALFNQIHKVAPTKGRVLITGESGTGKELIARAIHDASALAKGPFIKVNCAAIPPELIESELFGHERGAFTGAVARKRGLFEAADEGTIFLDEIGDMSLSAQAKVLRVLQVGELVRVGGEKVLKVDTRVLAATNKDLEAEVATGRFREDLFFRLNVVPLRAPPLRERLDDLGLLAEAFVRQCCDENGFRLKRLAPGVVERLQRHRWPGNVRELRNVIERLVIMADDEITERDLPPYLMGGVTPVPTTVPLSSSGPVASPGAAAEIDPRRYLHLALREFRDEVERDFIRLKLRANDWNISRTAQELGIERTNLHKRLRALGIEREDG